MFSTQVLIQFNVQIYYLPQHITQLEGHKVIYDKLQIQINTLHLHFYIHAYIYIWGFSK